MPPSYLLYIYLFLTMIALWECQFWWDTLVVMLSLTSPALDVASYPGKVCESDHASVVTESIKMILDGSEVWHKCLSMENLILQKASWLGASFWTTSVNLSAIMVYGYHIHKWSQVNYVNTVMSDLSFQMNNWLSCSNGILKARIMISLVLNMLRNWQPFLLSKSLVIYNIWKALTSKLDVEKTIFFACL